MSMKKVPIDEASNAQLLDYCEVVLGIADVKRGQSNAYLRGKIETAQPGITEILVAETNTPPSAGPVITPTAGGAVAGDERVEEVTPDSPLHYRSDPKVRIIIPTIEGPGGDRAVPVCVNGDQFLIKRDVEVDVPYRVYEALNAAKMVDYSQKPGPTPTDRPEMSARVVLSYGFNVVTMPPRDEIDAYHARTRDMRLGPRNEPAPVPEAA